MRIHNSITEISLCDEIELKTLDCKSSLDENIRNIVRYFEENSEKLAEYLSHGYHSAKLEVLFEAQKQPKITITLKEYGLKGGLKNERN